MEENTKRTKQFTNNKRVRGVKSINTTQNHQILRLNEKKKSISELGSGLRKKQYDIGTYLIIPHIGNIVENHLRPDYFILLY